MADNCNHCGAIISGKICAYCGSMAAPSEEYLAQKTALDELHEVISSGKKKRVVALLKGGFLPDHSRILIDAGLKCIPYTDSSAFTTPMAISSAAIFRLRSIITKLKFIHAETPEEKEEVDKAIEEFESVVSEFEKQENKDTFYGCLLFLGIGVVVLGIVLYYMFRS